jgi:hypothetical protein
MGGDSITQLNDKYGPRGWRIWRGVNRQFYLWRQRTSPPDVRRYDQLAELRADVEYRDAQQRRWDDS